MAGIESGANTAGMANVDGAYNLNVTLPKDPNYSGYTRPLSEVDAGRSLGTPYLLGAEVSEDYRARTELDTVLDAHTFQEVLQHTGKHKSYATTFVPSWTLGGYNTNPTNSTTLSSGSLLQTQQMFPVFGGAETYAYFNFAVFGTVSVSNSNVDIGLFNGAIAQPFAPTDGVGLRVSPAGIVGFANFNGTEQVTAAFKVVAGGANWVPTIGTFYPVIVTSSQSIAVFWVDFLDGNGFTRVGQLKAPINFGAMSSQLRAPFAIRHGITATAASAAMSVKVGYYTIVQGGYQNTRSEITAAAILTGGQQGQQGQTQGSLSNYTNSLAPSGGSALSNTGAIATSLGGQISVLPTLAANTDGNLFSFQNPLPTSNSPAQTLLVHGVWIDGIVTTVLAGNATPVIYLASLCYGHTAASLATTEATAAKAPRRIYLGKQQYAAAAAVGAEGTRIYVPFARPLPVNPGEFVAVALKNIGVVTTSGVITFNVGFDASWAI